MQYKNAAVVRAALFATITMKIENACGWRDIRAWVEDWWWGVLEFMLDGVGNYSVKCRYVESPVWRRCRIEWGFARNMGVSGRSVTAFIEKLKFHDECCHWSSTIARISRKSLTVLIFIVVIANRAGPTTTAFVYCPYFWTCHANLQHFHTGYAA